MIVVLVGVGGWVELVIALLLLSVEIPLAFCTSKENARLHAEGTTT